MRKIRVKWKVQSNLPTFVLETKNWFMLKKCLRFNIILKLKVNPGRIQRNKIKKPC